MESQVDKMVGVEVGKTSVRAVMLAQERGRWRIGRFSEIPIGGVSKAGNPLQEACFEAVGEVGDALVISSLPAADVLARQLDIPVSKEKEIQAVRNFQVEPLLPFSIEEAVLDHEVIERTGDGVRLVVLSVLKERITDHLSLVSEVGIEPERLSCPAVALSRVVHHLAPSSESMGVLHLGSEATSCLIVREGKVVRARVIPLGATHLKEVLPKGKGFDFMNFEPSLAGIKSRAEAFRSEVAKTFYSITQRGATSLLQIFVSGEFDSFRNLDVYLGQAIEYPIVQLPQKSPLYDHEFRTARYAIPLGMLLDNLPKRKGEERRMIDFRRGDFSYPKPWKRARKRIAAYLVSSCLAAALILAGGEGLIRKKKGALHTSFKHLVEGEDLAAGANRRLKELNQQVETYPLQPNIPKVAEVLAWLESHPKMEGVRVDNLHYTLQKRPDSRRPKEHYQAKVELDLKTQSPTQARELHDALLLPSEMVDGKQELEWKPQGDRVHVSFVLQDKTRYL